MRWSRFSLVVIAFCGLSTTVVAQLAPFDMSPERPAGEGELPQMPRPRPVTPRVSVPQVTPQAETEVPAADYPPASSPLHQPAQVGAPQQTEPPEKAAAQSPAAGATLRRYIIPTESLALTGEYSRSTWSIYLTAEQAEAAQSINLGYQNAIVIAPEASTLTLFINNRRVGEERISAPDATRSVRWPIPAGLLRPGSNDVELVASQRHRTDCDVRSTYDLWTQIDSGETYMQFGPHLAPANSAVEAVNALGADPEGLTQFQMVVPSVGAIEELAPLLKLTQGLAVMNGMPNPRFSFREGLPDPIGAPGSLTVAIGPAAKLANLLPSLPPGAEAGPVSAVTPSGDGKTSIIVFTGPTWSAVGSAIDSFLAPVVRSPTLRRESMSNERWVRPNAPFVFGGERLSFAQLGISTIEFSGRRLRTGFDIAVPSDFYAGAYGEATILLDAAYGGQVTAGSHIDVYVNGNIASTVPITESGGGILRQAPIRITMRHLRAGINRIEVEAILLSDADSACIAGGNASTDARFALFDSSAFYMPSYARIGQTPNLSALSGTGFPYSRQTEPAAFFMDRIDADMLSAAANFLGKAAQVSGAPIALEPVSAANAVGGRNAIYIGSAGQLPANVLTQLNLDPNLAAAWDSAAGEGRTASDTAASMEAWRGRLQGGFLSQKIAFFREWLQAKLDLSEEALRFLPGGETVFSPDEDDDLLLVQGSGVNGSGIWTVLTAPSPQELRLATGELGRQDVWQQIEGRIFSYSRATDDVSIQEASKLAFLPPLDTSFNNYRLIAANWLSSNLLSYALAIVLVSCLLGVTTASLLRWLGRRT